MNSRFKLILFIFLLAALPVAATAQQGAEPAATPQTSATDSQISEAKTPAQADTSKPAAPLATDANAQSTQSQSTQSQDSQAGGTSSGQAPATGQNSTAADSSTASGQSADSAKPADNATPEPDNPKVKAGSNKDVDAIGNRKLGKRGLGNWYSYESEIKLGRQYAQMVESSSKLVTDPVVTEYINRIGQNIVRNSDAKVPFTIKVIDSDEINAFALPGGFFYINSGLILAADEEAELAGVMAHEIAHVCARHAMKEMTREQWAQLGMIPLVIFGGTAGYIAYETSGLTVPITFLKFSREFETQADYLGVQYMYKAGYDPQAYIAFFEKLQAKEKKKPGTVARVFMDHPLTPDRIAAAQKEISTILPARESYTISTSEFSDVKARLAAIENKRRLQDDKDSKKPSLRRKNSDDNPDSNSTNTDDRPTLKKRD